MTDTPSNHKGFALPVVTDELQAEADAFLAIIMERLHKLTDPGVGNPCPSCGHRLLGDGEFWYCVECGAGDPPANP